MDSRCRSKPPVPIAAALLLIAPTLLRAADDAGQVVATVNGEKITAGDLEFAFMSRRVPPEERERARGRVLDQLIDRRLMAGFLKDRNAKPDDTDVKAEVDRIRDQIRKAGDDPDRVLAKLAYSEDRLKQEVALPLAWKIHARRAVTDTQLRDFWKAHREEYDGTQVRASQIFLKVPTDKDSDELKAAEDKLKSLRADVMAGKLTFAAAAEQHSQAPSRANGGDVGWFPYRGKMPPQFSEAAFPLKKGELSEPFRTPFGVHLVTVTDRKPGDLSLEDVRSRVFERVQQDLWDEILRDLRSKAKIEK